MKTFVYFLTIIFFSNLCMHTSVASEAVSQKTQRLTPLMEAAIEGNVEGITQLIKTGTDINAQDPQGNTALHWALQMGKHEAAQALLNAEGIERDRANKDGLTPLMLAAQDGYDDIVKFLIENGADINKRDTIGRDAFEKQFVGKGSKFVLNTIGYPPLMYAARAGNEEIVKLLLAAGANPLAQAVARDERTKLPRFDEQTGDPVVVSARSLAEKNGKTDVVKLLDEKLKDADSKGKDLIKAIAQDKIEEVKKLLTGRVNSNYELDNTLTPLIVAIHKNNKPIIELLLASGADPNKATTTGRAPLLFAVQQGFSDIVKMLIDVGANVNKSLRIDKPPALPASSWGTSPLADISRTAYQEGIRTRSPLTAAIDTGNKEIVQELLVSGADVNKADGYGDTPLTMAAHKGNKDIVDMLIKAKADVNKDAKDSTPLIEAASGLHSDIIKMLLAAGAQVNKASKHGDTPLLSALSGGDAEKPEKSQKAFEVAQLLLKAGADINAQDKEGKSTFFSAIMGGFTPIVKDILATGKVDVNKPFVMQIDEDMSMKTFPLAISVTSGNPELVELLLQAGADAWAKDENFEGKTYLEMVQEQIQQAQTEAEKSKLKKIADLLENAPIG